MRIFKILFWFYYHETKYCVYHFSRKLVVCIRITHLYTREDIHEQKKFLFHLDFYLRAISFLNFIYLVVKIPFSSHLVSLKGVRKCFIFFSKWFFLFIAAPFVQVIIVWLVTYHHFLKIAVVS